MRGGLPPPTPQGPALATWILFCCRLNAETRRASPCSEARGGGSVGGRVWAPGTPCFSPTLHCPVLWEGRRVPGTQRLRADAQGGRASLGEGTRALRSTPWGREPAGGPRRGPSRLPACRGGASVAASLSKGAGRAGAQAPPPSAPPDTPSRAALSPDVPLTGAGVHHSGRGRTTQRGPRDGGSRCFPRPPRPPAPPPLVTTSPEN